MCWHLDRWTDGRQLVLCARWWGMVTSGSISLGLGFYFPSWTNCNSNCTGAIMVPFASVLTWNKWGVLFANSSACKIAPRTPWKCVMCAASQLLLHSLYWCCCRSSDLPWMTMDFFFGGLAWKKKKRKFIKQHLMSCFTVFLSQPLCARSRPFDLQVLCHR